MSSEDKRMCKKCLLRDMSQADKDMIKKYIDVLKEDDRVSDEVYEKRLSVCKECDKLVSGTCFSCGCYVEIRACSVISYCPNKKW